MERATKMQQRLALSATDQISTNSYHLIRWSAPEGQRTPETIYEILDTYQTNEALSLLLAVGIGFHASNRHLSATE